jgi:hypothetical protein
MRKNNKLYIIIAVIASIFLLTTAATCNQCKATTTEEEISIEDEEEAEEVAEEVEVEEEEAEEVADEEEVTEEEEEEAEEVAEEDMEAPTILLEVYEGPTLSGNICYYRVKAKVTGNPTPEVKFSKDDSNGAFGEFKAQINLNDPADTYTLTATATNSKDSDTASETFDWGCSIPNNPPEIIELTYPILFPNEQYVIEAIASDPDGDSLSYQWSVNAGTLLWNTSKTVKWVTPASAGYYEITVIIEDGKGGTDTKTETVRVIPLFVENLSIIEWGHVIKDTSTCRNSTCKIMVGDYSNNKPVKGFVSFNISNMAGHKVRQATLVFTNPLKWGDPTFNLIQKIRVEVVDWGSDGLKTADFDISGIELLNSSYNPDFTFTNQEIKDTLQDAIDNSKDRYQIRVYHSGSPTNNNNTQDTWSYSVNNISLQVQYYMPVALP